LATSWCWWSHSRKTPLQCFSWWGGKFVIIIPNCLHLQWLHVMSHNHWLDLWHMYQCSYHLWITKTFLCLSCDKCINRD
jgi:hypothetical protein